MILNTLKITTLEKKYLLNNRIDKIVRISTTFLAICLLVLVFTIAYQLYEASLPSMKKFGWSFLRSTEWNPVTENFGALVAVYGTLMSAFIALLLGVPISFG